MKKKVTHVLVNNIFTVRIVKFGRGWRKVWKSKYGCCDMKVTLSYSKLQCFVFNFRIK